MVSQQCSHDIPIYYHYYYYYYYYVSLSTMMNQKGEILTELNLIDQSKQLNKNNKHQPHSFTANSSQIHT